MSDVRRILHWVFGHKVDTKERALDGGIEWFCRCGESLGCFHDGPTVTLYPAPLPTDEEAHDGH